MMMIIVEGNIGAGKSTLTKELAKHLGAKAFFEPVESNPYLESYYQDPKKYALAMQFYLMSVRYEMHLEGIEHIWRTGTPAIFDRSIYGDAVFAKRNWLDGNMTDLDFENYNKMRRVMFKSLMVPHVTLYLKNSPERTLQNINSRSRGCEASIPLEYLKGLHDLYRELTIEMDTRGSKVIEIDWNEFRPVEDVLEKLTEFREKMHFYPKIVPKTEIVPAEEAIASLSH
ncbi:MAG: deoxynucleoside kinase [Bdellovibrionales bacterium]|nr:deoxynucleoside kinase [Bdellovibrionales bacterium]